MFTLQDLLNAGLPAVSTDGNGPNAATRFERELTAAEWLTYLSIADPVRARQVASKTTAKNIPNWATWTQTDWATWRDANVSATQIDAIGNLADAKVMLNKMSVVLDSLAKMEIALRDQVWPDLPE